jgi:hypothetical protein
LYTLNQILSLIENEANAHLQVKQFGQGDVWEINPKELDYLVLWAIEEGVVLNERTLTYNIRLLAMDRVLPGEENEQEVMSDTIQVLLDFVAYFRQLHTTDLSIQTSVSLEPFTERFDDKVSGHACVLSITQPYDYNKCQIPHTTNFISTWDTTQGGSASDTIVLPMAAGTTVNWGDGTTNALNTHTYTVGGVYTITIFGSVTGFQFNDLGDKLKLTGVLNCGGLVLDSSTMFYGCSNLITWSATDAPTITTTSLYRTFREAGGFTGDFSSWDVSGVGNFQAFLRQDEGYTGTTGQNPNISSWTTTSLVITKWMFADNPVFNRNINGWDFSLVTDVDGMFSNTNNYDQPMGALDISSITTGFDTFMSGATGLSPANYGATLIGWAAQLPIAFSGVINMGGSTFYSTDAAVVAARNAIISSVGGITDGGGV